MQLLLTVVDKKGYISRSDKKRKNDSNQYPVHYVLLNYYSIFILLTCQADRE
ncbi:hypothetical protein CSB67_4849 [Enterobacter hormaechei]|nr:hypothetical protein CSB67_4849 [Enterobacter hormaechei]